MQNIIKVRIDDRLKITWAPPEDSLGGMTANYRFGLYRFAHSGRTIDAFILDISEVSYRQLAQIKPELKEYLAQIGKLLHPHIILRVHLKAEEYHAWCMNLLRCIFVQLKKETDMEIKEILLLPKFLEFRLYSAEHEITDTQEAEP